MSELTVLEPDEIVVFSDEDKSEAEAINADIENLLDSISNHELRLATSYVRLGLLLLRAQKTRYFGGYVSFAQYLGYIEERIGRARSQIYAYVGVAERLAPYISEANLERMGISRAQELVRYVKHSGLAVPSHLLLDALDPKIKLGKLHTNVSEALHEKGEVKGSWWEPFAGAYFLPDEKAEVQQAIELAKGMNPSDTPDHVQRKEILLAWAREFVSSNPIET